jgi:Tfp pilus assembly protein PilN
MVKFFSINLNKSEGLAEREARWRKRREMIIIVSFMVIFSLLSLFAFRNHQALGEIMDTKSQKIAEIERRLVELERTGKNISKSDVLTLARMEKERFLWTTKLRALAQIIPEDVALTLLEFNKRQLRIKAISKIMADEKEFDKVSEFMDMLKQTPFFYREFTNIRFSESHRVRIEDQEILSITIECTLEKASRTRTRSSSTRSSKQKFSIEP